MSETTEETTPACCQSCHPSGDSDRGPDGASHDPDCSYGCCAVFLVPETTPDEMAPLALTWIANPSVRGDLISFTGDVQRFDISHPLEAPPPRGTYLPLLSSLLL